MKKDPRDEIHRRGLNNWARNNFRGILLYGTGSGKTYCGIRALEYFLSKNDSARFLIVTPTYTIIENWKTEIAKFKKKHLLKHIDFICYNSVLKFTKFYDLVVLDEVHHCTSELKLNFFRDTQSTSILGLTASLTTPQRQLLKLKSLPIVDTYAITEAAEDLIISPFKVCLIKVNLTDHERKLYRSYSKQIDEYYQKEGANNWVLINKRKAILANASKKFEILPGLIEGFGDRYGLIFNSSTENADKVCAVVDNCLPIHSKVPKKQLKNNLKLFSDGRSKVKILSSSKMLDEGVTLPRLSYSIILTGYSSERQSIQRIGRNVRKNSKNPKEALVVRVYCIDTVEEKWVEESLKSFKCITIKNYEELKEIIRESDNV